MTRLRSTLVAAGLVLAVTVVPAASSSPDATSDAALQTARAVVNIRGSNRVISFSGSVSGLGALQLAGANVETVTYGPGTAVCSINGVGNPPIPGQCLGEQSGTYWSYWRAGPGAGGFSYSGTGAGGTSVVDGAVEGWNFGNGPPPFSSFCAVAGCAPPPPPPPPPPTPAPTAAPTGGGSGGGGSGGAGATAADGGAAAEGGSANDGGSRSDKGSGKGSGKQNDGKGGDGQGSAGGSADTTSTTRGGKAGAGGGESTRAAGPIELEASSDSSSPWGVIAAGAVVAGLGAGGMIIRRRRRVTPL
jgi:hypothetical protein